MMQLNPFQLERYFARYEFAARYLLCSSDCESMSIKEILDMEEGAASKFQQHWLGYTESTGAPPLRQEVSRTYTGIQEGEVLIHSGAEEAIFLFMQAVLQPGDHVIVHWPCYQSLFEVARSIGCRVDFWEGRESANWVPDLEELKALIKPETRAIIINFPHNPTGASLPLEAFKQINDLASRKGITLFSDEVYRDLEYETSTKLPSACEINPTAISLGVMSKSYGLAGLRIGWIASHNRGVMEQMAELKDYTTICSSAPSEFLAEIAVRHRQQVIDRNRQIIKGNLILLDAFFQAHQDHFKWVRPAAGPIAFPILFGEDIESFCHQLVTEAGVLLLPGTLFHHPGNHFRIGFGRRNMPESLERLERFLAGKFGE